MILYWNPTEGRMAWKPKERDVRMPGQVDPEPESDEPTLEEMDDIELLASDPVLTWRAKRLADNGMTPPQARTLALDRSVDVTWVVDRLLKRGCDPAVAFDISSGVMAA